MEDQEIAKAIRERVCEKFKVTESELDGASRAVRIAWPRQIAQALIQKHTRMTHERTGELFGGRTAGSVTHAVARYRDLITVEKTSAALVADIERSLFNRSPIPL